MILAVVLLSATGYLSYRNLSSIVASIQVDTKPDPRLASIREISMDLEKAQNSIRIFSSTYDTLDLQPYYSVISDIDEKVSKLHTECINDSILLQQTDTISKLIEQNIIIWNQLLYLHNSRTVLGYLKQLSVRLDSSSSEAHKTEKNILKRVLNKNQSRLNEDEIISNLKELRTPGQHNKSKTDLT